MPKSMQIYLALLNNPFHAIRAEDIQGGERFHLGVGAVVSAYNNGTVMVQGRFKPRYEPWARRTLTRILPKGTQWHDT